MRRKFCRKFIAFLQKHQTTRMEIVKPKTGDEISPTESTATVHLRDLSSCTQNAEENNSRANNLQLKLIIVASPL